MVELSFYRVGLCFHLRPDPSTLVNNRKGTPGRYQKVCFVMGTTLHTHFLLYWQGFYCKGSGLKLICCSLDSRHILLACKG